MNLAQHANNPVFKQVLFNFSNSKYSPQWYVDNINVHAKSNQAGNPQAKRKGIYTGWSSEDFNTFFSAVEALKAAGLTPGGNYTVQEVQTVVAGIFQANPQPAAKPKSAEIIQTTRTQVTKVQSNIAAPQAKLEPVQKLSKTAQANFINARINVINTAQFLAGQPSSLELGNLALRTTPLAVETQNISRPIAEQNILNYLQGKLEPKPKFSLLWEKYLPQKPEAAELEIVQVARESTKVDKLFNTPLIAELLADEAACAIYDSIKKSQGRAQQEHILNEDWKEKRPAEWNWANKATNDFIKFNFPSNGTDAYQAANAEISIARLAGFRALDAHFTGEQQFEGNIIYKKPKFQFAEALDPAKRREFESKFGFLKLGKVSKVEYGVNESGKLWHQKAMTECSFEASRGQDIKFQPDHIVAQIANEIHPIMSLSDVKAIQKGLVGRTFLAELNHLAKLSQNTQVTRVDAEVLQKSGLIPEDLLALGINPMQDINRARAGAVTLREIPAFAEALQLPDTRQTLVEQSIKNVVVKPLIAGQEQFLMIRLLESINPGAYKSAITNPGETEQEKLANRNNTFELAVIMASKDQSKALNKLVATRNIEVPKHQFQTVTADARQNWKKLPPADPNNPEPNGWFLLKDHIANMTKDGLSKRTIKMAGAYSVVDPNQVVDIVSRYGRSEPNAGMKANGRLLVYANPLIKHEQHCGTDLAFKKYTAPDGSCNPPLVAAAQAKFTEHNRQYLKTLNGKDDIAEIETALKAMQGYEKELDQENYINFFVEGGFGADRAKVLGKALYSASTSHKLYDAINDPNAAIEITEGQKKVYKMYQSYKELVEAEDKEFAQKLPKSASDAELLDILQRKPNRPNKLFVCSPGVWMPVKSWRKFTAEDKASFCASLNVEDLNGSNSPLNANCKYALTPPWINMIDMTGRSITITYDSDVQDNIGVAQSVSAMSQTIKDAFPNSKLNYRLIAGKTPEESLGADDYIVKYGEKSFWDELVVGEIAPNVGHPELIKNKGKSYIKYLVDKQAKMGDMEQEQETLVLH